MCPSWRRGTQRASGERGERPVALLKDQASYLEALGRRPAVPGRSPADAHPNRWNRDSQPARWRPSRSRSWAARRGRRSMPGGAVHAAARVRRRRAEVQAGDPRLGAAQPGHRPEDQLLVQLGGAAVDRAADQVGVARLELARAQHAAGAGRATRSRGPALDPGLHPVGEPLAVVAVPRRRGCRRRPASPAVPLRARGCRPTSTRCRPATGSGRWWSSGRRAGTARAGTAPAATCAERLGHARRRESATWTVPGASAGGRGPGHRRRRAPSRP